MSKLFADWVQKSEKKFGPKFSETLQTGFVTLDQLRLFRFSDVVKRMEQEKRSNISFAELYLNSKTDMLIPCPRHGLVCMTPYQHLVSTTGCTKCSGKYQRTEEEFDRDLASIFGTTISRIDPYLNQKTPMMMKCQLDNNHPPFRKTGGDLLNGHQGCPSCQIERSSETRRWKKDEWVQKCQQIHSNGIDDYSHIILEIVNSILWVHDIFCTSCKVFYCQRANDHHNGHRCVLCKSETLSKQFRIPYDELIKRCREIHNEEKYEYDPSEPIDYTNGNSKIPVLCNQTFPNGDKHGVWYPTAHNHLCGSKCPGCKSVGYSKVAIEWLDLLSKRTGLSIQHAQNGGEYKIPGSRYSSDGKVVGGRCLFEFHGCHVHGCKECYPDREEIDCYGQRTHDENYQKTLEKKQFCLEQGYQYVEMWYCQWETIKNSQELLEKHIQDVLQLKTTIKLVC